jgi:hypothetical protein
VKLNRKDVRDSLVNFLFLLRVLIPTATFFSGYDYFSLDYQAGLSYICFHRKNNKEKWQKGWFYRCSKDLMPGRNLTRSPAIHFTLFEHTVCK